MAIIYPTEYCHGCERFTQRRDGNPNCFWCGLPYGSKPASDSDSDLVREYLHSNCERRIQLLEEALQKIQRETKSPRVRAFIEKVLQEERSL